MNWVNGAQSESRLAKLWQSESPTILHPLHLSYFLFLVLFLYFFLFIFFFYFLFFIYFIFHLLNKVVTVRGPHIHCTSHISYFHCNFVYFIFLILSFHFSFLVYHLFHILFHFLSWDSQSRPQSYIPCFSHILHWNYIICVSFCLIEPE